ncbi:zinc ribbon domain-containing protein [Natrarchaeobaculum aegyptiacum]|uniref:DUF8106 domain-containing protein n=1 Tax=Natrarchaeobaculum aegyptiacum TaxID=745377 RepID=A0A2Z2HUW9_9EURY|nr:zinc ribbon domain-containing protein [Natrarchaeobaculum aegyptiacum]ARS91096.1 hypothetical protein B1756_16060 [Natrarchaeobaculum aegyptiacum]
MTGTVPSNPATRAGTRRKSTLFCPACDHQSPVDGDWVIDAGVDTERYVCPDCGYTLTERPRPRSARPLSRLAQSSVDVWRTSLEAGVAGYVATWGYPMVAMAGAVRS